MCVCVCARPIIVSYGRPSHVFNGMRVCNVMFDVLLLNRYVAYRFFFSRNKYIDIELPSLICTKFPFSLLALHYPPTQLLTCIHNTRERACGSHSPSLSLFSFLFSSLAPAISRASRASFVLLSFRTRALAFTRTYA